MHEPKEQESTDSELTPEDQAFLDLVAEIITQKILKDAGFPTSVVATTLKGKSHI